MISITNIKKKLAKLLRNDNDSIRISAYVDQDWYLKTYPDVAQSGLDPIYHYAYHGKYEGRLPSNLPAIALERDVWENAFEPQAIIDQLSVFTKNSDLNGLYACKVLSSFYLFQENFDKARLFALRLLEDFNKAKIVINESLIFILAFESVFKVGDKDVAKEIANNPNWPKSSSKQLARQMLDENQRDLKQLNKIFTSKNLLKLETKNSNILFDSLVGTHRFNRVKKQKRTKKTNALVSIIVPCFNAENTLKTCLNSLLMQTYPNIEIIIVDDCSKDESFDIAQSFTHFENIKVIKNDRNLGAYASRNIGAKVAKGSYITVMDADDWSHPQKIEQQALALIRNKELVGCLSHWVRCDNSLQFCRLRADNSWVYRNLSSFMLKRSVFEEIGYWDVIKANADSEFLLRTLAKYGEDRIVDVLPDTPLSFGRTLPSSLTNRNETHLVSLFGGPRKLHLDFAKIWHRFSTDLYLEPCKTPFPIPHQLTSEACLERFDNRQLERWQSAFDNAFYLRNYRNVNALGLNLHQHYWTNGELEDCSPSSNFVPSAYRYRNALPKKLSPTWHALTNKWDFDQPVRVEGSSNNVGKHIAIFGHSLSSCVFGAELSLLDMVEACYRSGYAISIFLPNALNTAYIESLKKFVVSVYFVPLFWYHKNRQVEFKQVEIIESVIKKYAIELIYVNTIMLYEPFVAASNLGVVSLTHIRELPEYDPSIRTTLKESENESKARLLRTGDYFIANSNLTASWLNEDTRTKVIYNPVKEYISTEINCGTPLRVCMISSNTEKKGVHDFFEIAKLCFETSIEFNLYGPITHQVEKAKLAYDTSNINFKGYIDDVTKAIEENDIVLCLSWFKESFGRTAAEAMINKRAVIAYDWGAFQEYIPRSSGMLLEYKNTKEVVKLLCYFMHNKIELKKIAQEFQFIARKLFGFETYHHNICVYLQDLFERESKH